VPHPKRRAGQRRETANGHAGPVRDRPGDSTSVPAPCAAGHVGAGIPRLRNFNLVWRKVLTDAGIAPEMDLHLLDLRHTGSAWSAQSVATFKELMARIGDSSTRAAMIYQHATRDRDRAIAPALDQ
jgi:integrase